MFSLFQVKFNWSLYFLIGILMLVFFPMLSAWSFFALMISLHQFMLLFNAMGTVIPIRYLLGSFMCLQMLVGPVFAYSGLDAYQSGYYKMVVSESTYFSYVLPAVVAFIVGLHLRAGKLDGERPDRAALTAFVKMNPLLPYVFIGLGLVASVVSNFVHNANLTFIFYLLGNFKYIGLFLLLLGGVRLKVGAVIVVVGSVISTSLGQGMFADLLTWLLFIASVGVIKYKPSSFVKAAGAIFFIGLSVVIQQFKTDYRQATWNEGQEGDASTFYNVLQQNNEKKAPFSKERLAKSNIRINQGYIVTHIMNNVPSRVPFSNGDEMSDIIEAALLPRFIAPNKLSAGNRAIFTKYAAIPLAPGTSMGLSSLGDAYLNFDVLGGIFFMFLLGFLYSEVLRAFQKYGKNFPILLLFTSLVFYYPIRPDCELQTILGHLVKSVFLIWAILQIWKGVFRLYGRTKELPHESLTILAQS